MKLSACSRAQLKVEGKKKKATLFCKSVGAEHAECYGVTHRQPAPNLAHKKLAASSRGKKSFLNSLWILVMTSDI